MAWSPALRRWPDPQGRGEWIESPIAGFPPRHVDEPEEDTLPEPCSLLTQAVHEKMTGQLRDAEEEARRAGFTEVAEQIADDREHLQRQQRELQARMAPGRPTTTVAAARTIPARPRGAARQSRPAPTRRRGSRRGSTSTRGSPSDDAGDPEPPSRGRGAAHTHHVDGRFAGGSA